MLETLREVPEVLATAVASVCTRDARAAALAGARASEIGARERALQDSLLCLLAREAPVAGDLRQVIALMGVGTRVARMAVQCGSVARMGLLLPASREPSPEQLACITEMAEIAALQVRASADAFERRDRELALTIHERDGRINERNDSCFARAVRDGGDEPSRETGLLLAMVARAIERVGDNAVAAAEQGALAATGAPGWRSRG